MYNTTLTVNIQIIKWGRTLKLDYVNYCGVSREIWEFGAEIERLNPNGN